MAGKNGMCKVWKTNIHIIHGVNTGKIGNAHTLYTGKTKVIHRVIHRLWIMLITVTRYRVESTKIELVFVRVRRTVWINCGKMKNPCTAAENSACPENRVRAAFFPKKTAKIIDFRVDEMGVYEYN